MKKRRCERHVPAPYTFGGFPCANLAVGRWEGRWLCGVHSPQAEARRREKQEKKYQEKSRAWKERWKREQYDRDAGAVCLAFGITNPKKELKKVFQRAARYAGT